MRAVRLQPVPFEGHGADKSGRAIRLISRPSRRPAERCGRFAHRHGRVNTGRRTLMARSPASRYLGNLQILADLLGKVITDFCVPWHGRPAVEFGVMPPGMLRAFTQQLTSVMAQIPQQLLPLHTAIEASSKFPPAAPMASCRFSSSASLRVTRRVSSNASLVLS